MDTAEYISTLEQRIANIEHYLFNKSCECKICIFEKCVKCSKPFCNNCELYYCSECQSPICIKCVNYVEYVIGAYIGKNLCDKCYLSMFLSHCTHCCSDIDLAKDDICKVCKKKIEIDDYSKLGQIKK